MKPMLRGLAFLSSLAVAALAPTSAHAGPTPAPAPPPPAWVLPPPPPPSAWPRLDVLFQPPAQQGTAQQGTAQPIDFGPLFAQLQQAQAQMAQCPPIEIAPGIRIPLPCTPLPPRPPVDPREPDIVRPAFLAPAVDLRAAGLDGPVRDQGPVGVCWAFALTTAMESSLRRAGRPDRLSPLHVVAADTWSSLWTKDAAEAITHEHVWPYEPVKACRFETGRDSCETSLGVSTQSWQSDPRLVQERNTARMLGAVRATRAASLKKPIRETDVAAVLSGGRPVEVALEIDSHAWGWRGMQGGRLPPYGVADRGGHEVVIVGYRPVGMSREFLIHNSWGTKWGEGGYAWIGAAELERHILSAMIIEAR